MTAKAIYTETGWKLMKLSLLLLLAGGCAIGILFLLGSSFRPISLIFLFLPVLLMLGISFYMRAKLALKQDGIYRESALFKTSSLLAPWRQVQRIDRQRLRFYSSFQKVTIYLNGDRKFRFIMPHAEEFLNELQFRVL